MFRSGLSYLAGTCWRRSITGSQGRSLHVSTCVELPAVRGLKERIANGETVLCAEGYLLALSRRGYIAHGVWVPECILEQPEVLRSVHEEFVHAGTDVVEAFQVNWCVCVFTLRSHLLYKLCTLFDLFFAVLHPQRENEADRTRG